MDRAPTFSRKIWQSSDIIFTNVNSEIEIYLTGYNDSLHNIS